MVEQNEDVTPIIIATISGNFPAHRVVIPMQKNG